MTARPAYVWDGSEWVPVGPTTAESPFYYQATPPTSPSSGDVWVDSDGDVDSIVTNAGDFATQSDLSTGLSSKADLASPTFTGNVSLPATTDYDGTQLSTTLASKQADVMTTKGDLAAFSSAVARLAVGSNTQMLVADSAQALGVKWAGTFLPASGYVVLANNLKIQWGLTPNVASNTLQTVTYPIAFTTNSSVSINTRTTTGFGLGANISGNTGSNFTWWHNAGASTNGSWIAVGV